MYPVPLGDGKVPALAVNHANWGGNNKGEVFAAFLLNQAKGFNNDGGFAVAGRHVQQRELSATVTHAVVEFFGQPGCAGVIPVNVFDFVPVVVEFGQVGVVGDSRWFGRFLRLFLGGRGVGACSFFRLCFGFCPTSGDHLSVIHVVCTTFP